MGRLIDADKLKEHYAWWGTSSNPDWVYMKKVVDDIVDLQPTIDAVEVVRCKDCKHKQGSACDYSAVWVRPNGFCQWGERKDDE